MHVFQKHYFRDIATLFHLRLFLGAFTPHVKAYFCCVYHLIIYSFLLTLNTSLMLSYFFFIRHHLSSMVTKNHRQLPHVKERRQFCDLNVIITAYRQPLSTVVSLGHSQSDTPELGGWGLRHPPFFVSVLYHTIEYLSCLR